MQRTRTIGIAAGIALLAAACGEKGKPTTSAPESAAAPSAAAPSGAGGGGGGAALSTTPLTPAPGRKVIVVELITDETGNYFKPKKIEAHRGDVVRYTLKTGVHNVHFLPDSNPGKKDLPPASELLQLPGQTLDLLVNLEPGDYYFQCDPHALLGMRGELEVEDED
ncbi:MAG: hypothetical protein IRY91_00165 [Gemmatimonadaceae bacterium]|nr:hypothetical protein [Gemmatimonadaceae bacterium]